MARLHREQARVARHLHKKYGRRRSIFIADKHFSVNNEVLGGVGMVSLMVVVVVSAWWMMF